MFLPHADDDDYLTQNTREDIRKEACKCLPVCFPMRTIFIVSQKRAMSAVLPIPHGDVRSTAAGGGKAPRSGVAGGDRREPPVSYNDIRRPRRGQRTQDMFLPHADDDDYLTQNTREDIRMEACKCLPVCFPMRTIFIVSQKRAMSAVLPILPHGDVRSTAAGGGKAPRSGVVMPVVTEGNLRYHITIYDVPEGGKERRTSSFPMRMTMIISHRTQGKI